MSPYCLLPVDEGAAQVGGAGGSRASLPGGHPKTPNLAWDEKERRVSLLDFGHAQEEERAVAVAGTRDLEAPEVVRKERNTQATDAHAVGAVLDVLETP